MIGWWLCKVGLHRWGRHIYSWDPVRKTQVVVRNCQRSFDCDATQVRY